MLSRIECPKIQMTREGSVMAIKKPNLMTLKLVLLFVFSMVFIYLIGCVYSASFFVTDWRQDERAAVCGLWVVSFIFFVGGILQEEIRKGKQNG